MKPASNTPSKQGEREQRPTYTRGWADSRKREEGPIWTPRKPINVTEDTDDGN